MQNNPQSKHVALIHVDGLYIVRSTLKFLRDFLISRELNLETVTFYFKKAK